MKKKRKNLNLTAGLTIICLMFLFIGGCLNSYLEDRKE